MAQAQIGDLFEPLGQPAQPAVRDYEADARLLASFAGGQEAAFATLVERHAGLVWQVCWNTLHHQQDAEDAFQATFLALARHAGSIRSGVAVASWLHRVASRIAVRAGESNLRRKVREQKARVGKPAEPQSEAAFRELQSVLQEELERLPEKYRSPIVLCCLEGYSKSEAAAQLGWKEGTLSGRLCQARKYLRRRLARRGLALSAVLYLCLCSREASAAIFPQSLATATSGGLSQYAVGQAASAVDLSARVGSLADAAGQVIAAGKLTKLVAAVALAVAVGTSGGLLAYRAFHGRGPAAEEVVASERAPFVPPDHAAAEGDVLEPRLRIRVVDTQGLPVGGANLRLRSLAADLATAVTDSQGRFETSAPLDPGTAYVVEAEAAGFRPDFSRWTVAPASGVAELPDLVLRRLVSVRGCVLDPRGPTIEGARVFSSGDGPRRTETVTDHQGRFRLDGLPQGQAILFVEHRGYHFQGRLIDTEQPFVPLPMMAIGSRSEVAPALPAVSRPTHPPYDAAMRLLAHLCHETARSDPRLAEQWLWDLGNGSGDDAGDAGAPADGEAGPWPIFRVQVYGLIAEAVAETDRDKARLYLERAVAWTPLDSEGWLDPRRGAFWSPSGALSSLVPIAQEIDPALVPDLVWRAVAARPSWHGTDDERQTLADAAAAELAVRLCPIDRSAGMTLLEEIKQRDWRRSFRGYTPRATVLAAAACDPAGTQRWIDTLCDSATGADPSPREAAHRCVAQVAGGRK